MTTQTSLFSTPRPVQAFNIGKVHIWGGNEGSVARSLRSHDQDWKLLVHLSDALYSSYSFKETPLISLNRPAEKLVPPQLHSHPVVSRVPRLTIDWPDYSVPELEPGWWWKLYEWLETLEGNVCFFCMGGHGRTGTALSILKGIQNAKKTEAAGVTLFDPVIEVRRFYDAEAVESLRQVYYVEEVCGFKMTQETRIQTQAAASARWNKYKNYTTTTGATPAVTTVGDTQAPSPVKQLLDEMEKRTAADDNDNIDCSSFSLVNAEGVTEHYDWNMSEQRFVLRDEHPAVQEEHWYGKGDDQEPVFPSEYLKAKQAGYVGTYLEWLKEGGTEKPEHLEPKTSGYRAFC